MAREGAHISGFCLQRNCFGRQLDVELMLGTIALAAEAAAGAVLTLRFGFVALLLAPSTCTKEEYVSAQMLY
jgi:hypothetical protein